MIVTMRLRILLPALSLLLAGHLLAQPERPQKKPAKKSKEPVTQVLPLLPDPPPAVVAETARLVFHVSPLSAKGLLTQQVRDALKALERDNRGAQIVKLRAFVAGTGDMRRVQQIVSEMFSEKKQPLPALTTIQVGALPLVGAQVVIESAGMDKKPVNPGGVVFLPPQPVEQLRAAAGSGDILRVTCFMNSLDGLPGGAPAAAFPAPAAANFVQLTRFGGEGPPLCEAVARAGGGAAAAGGATKVVFSGLQLAFRDQPEDIGLALDRLKRAVEPLGGRMDGAAVSVYGLARGPGGGPADRLVVEGLPALAAVVGVEMVAWVD